MAFAIVSVTSPFDAIKETDFAGDHWSARRLMPLLGYEKWERFEDAIERAKLSGLTTGIDVSVSFSRSREMVPQGGPARVDYRLNRQACYLIAMNGDVRKPEIAAAQAYFVAKTRAAELLQHAVPRTYAEALRAAADACDAVDRAKAELAVAAPKVEAFDTYLSATGKYLIGEVSKMLAVPEMGPIKLFQFLRANGVLIPEGAQRNMPYQRHVECGRFTVEGALRRNSATGELNTREDGQPIGERTTHVTPKGVEYIRGLLIGAGFRPAVFPPAAVGLRGDA